MARDAVLVENWRDSFGERNRVSSAQVRGCEEAHSRSEREYPPVRHTNLLLLHNLRRNDVTTDCLCLRIRHRFSCQHSVKRVGEVVLRDLLARFAEIGIKVVNTAAV